MAAGEVTPASWSSRELGTARYALRVLRWSSAAAYLIAAMACVAVAAAVPTGLYLILVTFSVFRSGDIGGPLNFVLVPLLGTAAGVVCALLFCAVVAAFRTSRLALVLLPIVTFAAVSLVTLARLHGGSATTRAAVGLAVGGWLALAATAFSCALATVRLGARLAGRSRGE